MIPIRIIEKAIAGGYGKGSDSYSTLYTGMIFDPNFWMALGKEMGWSKWGEYDDEYKKSSDPQWQYEAHRFYDLILRKASQEEITKFWETI